RDALFVHVQAGKHIILSGDKRLVSHRSASFGQCLLFQALYQSTRIENRHPSYKSQHERKILNQFQYPTVRPEALERRKRILSHERGQPVACRSAAALERFPSSLRSPEPGRLLAASRPQSPIRSILTISATTV